MYEITLTLHRGTCLSSRLMGVVSGVHRLPGEPFCYVTRGDVSNTTPTGDKPHPVPYLPVGGVAMKSPDEVRSQRRSIKQQRDYVLKSIQDRDGVILEEERVMFIQIGASLSQLKWVLGGQ